MVEGEAFLKGLGVRAAECPISDKYPIVSTFAEAEEYMSPKLLDDVPDPWPYQVFYLMVDEEIGRIKFSSGLPKEFRKLRQRQFFENDTEFTMHIIKRIEIAYKVNSIYEMEKAQSYRQESKEVNVFGHRCTKIMDQIGAYIHRMIEAAHYTTLSDSPLFTRMLEAFETGGMPCGWLGTDILDGGDPKDAVVLLHMGPALSK